MRIVLCGIYGGLGMRDLNPGCFMLAKATVDALRQRLPGAKFDVIAPDEYWNLSGAAPSRESVDGIELNFGATQSEQALREALSSAGGIVFGGDNLWTVPENPRLNYLKGLRHFKFRGADTRSLWLLEQAVLPDIAIPVVFNCVSSRSSLEGLRRNRRRLVKACSRAVYVGVRDVLLERSLRDEAGLENVFRVPDPVLALDCSWLRSIAVPDIPRGRGKPVLGVAIGPSFVAAFAEVFRQLQPIFAKYHVCFYAYSRMHQNWESHANLMRWISGDVSFIHDPLTPAQAFRMTGMFDAVMNDCYHGTIAAIIQGVPVIPFRFFDGERSRRKQLFDTLGTRDRSIKIAHRWKPVSHAENVSAMLQGLPDLLEDPVVIPSENLDAVKRQVERHFDAMASALSGSSV